jgi:hypothetical protein
VVDPVFLVLDLGREREAAAASTKAGDQQPLAVLAARWAAGI